MKGQVFGTFCLVLIWPSISVPVELALQCLSIDGPYSAILSEAVKRKCANVAIKLTVWHFCATFCYVPYVLLLFLFFTLIATTQTKFQSPLEKHYIKHAVRSKIEVTLWQISRRAKVTLNMLWLLPDFVVPCLTKRFTLGIEAQHTV